MLLPPVQSSFQKGKSIDYHPITSLSDGGPIEFKVSGSGKEFLDLARSYLHLKVKVSKADGCNLDGARKVGFTNYPCCKLVQSSGRGILISSATDTYIHRSILEVLLNFDQQAAESQLGCGFFCKYTARQIEEMLTADPFLNTGLETRSEWTKTSKIVELQGRIHSDLFNQEKRTLNGVDLAVKLHRHKPEFCLVGVPLSADTAPAYKITIVDVILYVKKIELNPSVFNAINTVLNEKNAQYAITRTTPEVFTVPRGQQSQHIDNAFLGEILKRITICMMNNDSYNGNYKKNQFNFKHYNLTQIGISVNGKKIPFKPLNLNFDDKLFVTAYNTCFSGTGKRHGNSGSLIK